MPSSQKVPGTSSPGAEPRDIATQFAQTERHRDAEDTGQTPSQSGAGRTNANLAEKRRLAVESRRRFSFERRFLWTAAFWLWLLCVHAVGIGLFTSGFLLARLVLEERSECANPPIQPLNSWLGQGTVDRGCWHPKTFDKAVIVLIDALRYDFTVPKEPAQAEVYHNAFPFMYDMAIRSPNNAFLRPFIADPPTATLQRLKGLTTGTLPTFIDLGSSFGGTAVDEDNLLMQLKTLNKRIVHLGDDTWTTLFPSYFQPNISKAYDSFNVWDLHTVDNGVLEHIFPLLSSAQRGEWDILIGHFLGVDHAGHRYGPDHPAMTAKLQQMNEFVENLVNELDDETLLVVMGDHGMDSKGDHGGESGDEVESALWMYSKTPVFGRTDPEFNLPPATAKLRPTNQIDLVPTLALLLGLPIPYNNLGRPIEEAFIGTKGSAWDNLAAVSRMTTAGIKRYLVSYFAARGIQQDPQSLPSSDLWGQREVARDADMEGNRLLYNNHMQYQQLTLRMCKDLWARFDVPKMMLGIVVMFAGLGLLLLYISKEEHDNDSTILENDELELAEKKLELEDTSAQPSEMPYQTLSRRLVCSALLGASIGATGGLGYLYLAGSKDWSLATAVCVLTSVATAASSVLGIGQRIPKLLPNTFSGWLAVLFTLSQSIGFASNSYTIWEDSITLFFLSTFGLMGILMSLRRPLMTERTLGVYHSVIFIGLGRLASASKLCREEQMPYCTSTYYASTNSSTSAPWQLMIPFIAFLFLPSIIKSYMATSRSYDGLAPMWIGVVFRATLFLSATYWVLDAAGNGNWITSLSEEAMKTIQVTVAQLVIIIVLVAGTAAFIWAPPCVSIITTASDAGHARVAIFGYGNAHGARYLLFLANFAVACILLSKPMGGGAMAIMLWQILSLIELIDLNELSLEAIGPVMLALLGNFHYFKTGHQAALSSIQWDSAFIPLFTLQYPWSPLAVLVNTFAGQIMACIAVPLLVLWNKSPQRKGLLENVTRAMAIFVSFYAVESLATMAWAGWLRRHLMLYRVFSPRFMMAATVLLVVDLIGLLVPLTGLRTNILAVSEVFGWAD